MSQTGYSQNIFVLKVYFPHSTTAVDSMVWNKRGWSKHFKKGCNEYQLTLAMKNTYRLSCKWDCNDLNFTQWRKNERIFLGRSSVWNFSKIICCYMQYVLRLSKPLTIITVGLKNLHQLYWLLVINTVTGRSALESIRPTSPESIRPNPRVDPLRIIQKSTQLTL